MRSVLEANGASNTLRIAEDLGRSCPYNCPCDAPKPPFLGQRQPSRSIGEEFEAVGFARKTDDGREADSRLANRRLQPLGHLTADATCT